MNLKLMSFIFSALFLCQSSIAQNPIFDWAIQFGGTGTERGEAIDVDASGNVYTVGRFNGTVDFDPGTAVFNLTSAGLDDVFITKVNASGNLLWAKSIGGTGVDMAMGIDIDAAGNSYITGSFTETVDFNPGAGIFNLTSAGGSDIFITKLDVDGNFVWAKGIGNTGSEGGSSIKLDGTGNIYTTGSFYGTVDFDPGAGVNNLVSAGETDVFVSKLDANGNFIWAKRMGGDLYHDRGYSIALDASGNCYTTGYFWGTADFNPGSGVYNLSSAGNMDIFISKLDVNGDFVWAKSLAGTDEQSSLGIAIDGSGNVYTTGNYKGTVDFNPGAGVFNLTSLGSTDIFISKLDANGNFVWAKSIGATAGGDVAKAIAVDASGNSYLTGSFQYTVDFDPGVGVFNLTSQGGGNDVFIAKLNAAGNFVWAKRIGGSSSDVGNAIALNSSGNIYLTGEFATTVDFNPGVGVNNLISAGSIDAFVLKLSPCQPINGTDIIASCSPYTWINGVEYSASTSTPTFTLVTSDGCDSVVTLNFTLNQPVTHSISETACSSFTWTNGNGQTYNTSTTATHTIPNGAANGCDSIITLNLTIGDLIAPVANTTSLADVTAQCSVASLTAPTATDNCAGTITGTTTTTFPITTSGTTVVTWTYDDGNGNTSTQTQNVIISDNTAPVATTSNLADVTGQCSVNSLTAPTAMDNCVGTITATHNATLPITTQGTTVVTWTYDDGNGNTSTQTQNVIISDNTAPVANTANLSDVTGQCSVNSLTAPTATDNCAGTITGTHNATLPITTQGTTVVTWAYDDGNGNTSTQTQNIIISDNTAPVANTANLSDVTGQCSVSSLTAPTAMDNCAGTITGIHNATLPITTSGTTVVIWTYADGNGNTSTQTQNVIVTVPVATTTLSGITISATTSSATYQWINCETGNTPITGATSQSFTATANGTYAVIVTQNGCSSTSACVVISSLGIESLNQNNWKVYPNPANEIVIVELNENTNIQILDVFGKIILSDSLKEGKNTIDINSLTPGIYFMQAASGATIKFVKK